MFGNMLTESHGFAAMPVTRCIKDTFQLIYPYLISELRRNCSSLRPVQQQNRDSQETCYWIWKHVKMNDWIFRKSESRGNKIARVY